MAEIVDKIFTVSGISKTGAMLTRAPYNRLLLPALEDIYWATADILNNYFEAGVVGAKTLNAPVLFATVPYDQEDTDPKNGYDPTTNYDYTVQEGFTGIFRAGMELDLTVGPGPATLDIRIIKSPSTVLVEETGISIALSTNTTVVIETEEQAFSVGDVILVQYKFGDPNLSLLDNSNTYFQSEVTSQNAGQGTTVDVTANMPDIQQVDLIKAVLNIMAAFVQYHPYENSVEFIQFKDIVTTNARDWSGLVDHSQKARHTFARDFAQKNYARYTDDLPEVTENLGRGSVDIPNTWLPAENDLFTLPFAASIQVTKAEGVKMAQCRLFNIDNNNEREFSPRPRILIRTDSEVTSVGYLNDAGVGSKGTAVKIAYFEKDVRTYGLDFDGYLIDNEWGAYKTIIEKARGADIRVMITPDFVQDIDFSKPVYLDNTIEGNHYNGFFFIDTVSKYDGENLLPEVKLLEI